MAIHLSLVDNIVFSSHAENQYFMKNTFIYHFNCLDPQEICDDAINEGKQCVNHTPYWFYLN